MALKDVVPGVYDGRVVDYGLQAVEKTGQIKAMVKFTFKYNEQDQFITWSAFLQKRDGELNKYTLDTLLTCGFKSKSVADLNDAGVLDTQKKLTLTLEKETGADGVERLKVAWVNDPTKGLVKTDVKKLKGVNLSKVDSYLKMNQQKVKNHADSLTGSPGDDNEPLPF